MTIEGTIIFISEETIVGQKQLPKVSFVIEEDSDREFKNSLMTMMRTVILKPLNLSSIKEKNSLYPRKMLL